MVVSNTVCFLVDLLRQLRSIRRWSLSRHVLVALVPSLVLSCPEAMQHWRRRSFTVATLVELLQQIQFKLLLLPVLTYKCVLFRPIIFFIQIKNE